MKDIIDIYDELWNDLSNDSAAFEQSMDRFYKKQTGSYYTALDLTYLMMKDLVYSLNEETRTNLFQKRFLEPCVGTGSFVFAYLRVCKELGFTQTQYIELINNIYVCDINQGALQIYKKGLKKLADAYFGITIDDMYFDQHIGGGLLFDLQSSNLQYIPIDTVFGQSVLKYGFDFVVTNPPYKNLKAEKSHYSNSQQYQFDREKYEKIGKLASRYFSYATNGTINQYKLFVEEIIERYLAADGVCALLIPASILSDKTCTKLRTRIMESFGIYSLRLIPENSSYVDASQALCAMLLHKGKKIEEIIIEGSINSQESPISKLRVEDVISESTGNSILMLSSNEYRIRKQMLRHPLVKNIPYIHNLRGELDLTLNKDSIIADITQYRLYRGRNISYYQLLSPNEDEYITKAFVTSTAKQKYIGKLRLACQQIANMKKKRRISFALVPENSVLGNSCNFVAVDENEDEVDLFFLLGILNSSLIDWYFKLTSSNNHINNYEIDMFPIPIYYSEKKKISAAVQAYLNYYDESLLSEIDAMVHQAYGITETLEGSTIDMNFHNKKENINERDKVGEKFFHNLQCLIPSVTKEDCTNILEGQASVEDVCFQKKPQISKFEKKVLEHIEQKYHKLYSGVILNHTTFKLSDLDLEMIRSVPQGGSWKDIPAETVAKSKRLTRITQTGGRTTLYGRIDYSKPSYTITTYFNRPGNGTYVHPVYERVISVREAARFQSFPDDYLFCGNKSDMLKQVGNAVPVILAYCIGKAIKEKTGCCTSVDLFSGAGGMTYGFKCAGINAVVGNDFEESACVTLKVNSPEMSVICGDITNEEIKGQVIQAGINGKADIICGGPPCQGFSMAGFRMKDDPRNEMFRHFVEIVSKVDPKVIVFENVEGLLSFQKGETYRNIIELFSELGYYTEGRTLFANHYGVPQRRKRVIILCTRKDTGIRPSELFPEPITSKEEQQITAYETIFDLENVPCSEDARYSSDYCSTILKYFKGEMDIGDYVSAVASVENICSSREFAQVDEMGEVENIPKQLTLF